MNWIKFIGGATQSGEYDYTPVLSLLNRKTSVYNNLEPLVEILESNWDVCSDSSFSYFTTFNIKSDKFFLCNIQILEFPGVGVVVVVVDKKKDGDNIYSC